MTAADQYLARKIKETLTIHQSDVEELKQTIELHKLSLSDLQKLVVQADLLQRNDETQKLNDTLPFNQSDVVKLNGTLESLKSTTLSRPDVIKIVNETIEMCNFDNSDLNEMIKTNQFNISNLANSFLLFKADMDRKFHEAITSCQSDKLEIHEAIKLYRELNQLNMSTLQSTIISNKLDIDKKIQETIVMQQSDNAALTEELTTNSEKLANLKQIINFNGLVGKYWKDCAATTVRYKSGLHTIRPLAAVEPFQVYCDMDTENGNWTVIQRRVDESVDFYRNWTEYKSGFGNLLGGFFIGLDKLHWLTADVEQELIVQLEDKSNNRKFAKFSSFAISDESTQYEIIKLGEHSGNGGNSLLYHVHNKFSTWDKDNDKRAWSNCAVDHMGGWWYNDCTASNLNGNYNALNQFKGVHWFENYKPLKFTQMMIRPKNIHI